MMIHLPHDLERSIHEAVESGHFASVDDAIAKAARLLLHELEQGGRAVDGMPAEPGLGSIGFMRDSADELDLIVADAMKRRPEETWRELPVE